MTALSIVTEGNTAMLQPIEKSPARQSLVHHPSDALDAFCCYEVTDRTWLDFDQCLSQQLIELEFANRRHIRVRPQATRR
jgi:hypothetical protein